MERKAIIKVESRYHNEIKQIMQNIFLDNCYLNFKNDYLQLISIDNDSFEFLLNNFLLVQCNDLQINIKIIIVPFFDDIFLKYFNMVSNGTLKTIFDIFVNNISNQTIKEDIDIIHKKISKKNIDTIKAYLSCNMNVLKASEMLYLHRNSLNYRLNQFFNETNMEIRDINTIMFLKLIIDFI